MGRKDPRIDAYIAKAPDFAKPVVTYVRACARAASSGIDEDIKWGMPTFVYRGKIICGVAAFKRHCNLIFWKGRLVVGPAGGARAGHFRNFTSVAELPSRKVLIGYIRKAVALNDAVVELPKAKRTAKKALPVPADLSAALKKNKKAQVTFTDFSPSHRREYIEWITGAKQDETRRRRVETAVAQMAERSLRTGST